MSTDSRLLEQDSQEQEYAFPYHYVTRLGLQFQHFFVDTWAINYGATIEFLIKKMRSESCKRVVDIGCGDGRFSRELALALPGVQVSGIDYSQRAINLAKAMNPDVPNLGFRSMDITCESGEVNFDLAVLMEVFEHIPLPDAPAFMAAVRRLMAPGGVLYLTVPHRNKPVEYKHFQHFSVDSLLEYLRPHFEVLDVVPFERRSVLRRVMNLLLSNRIFILANGRLLNAIYRWHYKHLLECRDERSCQRIFVRARAR